MVYVGNMLEGNYLYKIIPVKTVRKLVHFGNLDISIGRHPMYTLLWSKYNDNKLGVLIGYLHLKTLE